ncbi:MAG: polysaccharide deacetylase family protein [Desulfosarcina sp.]
MIASAGHGQETQSEPAIHPSILIRARQGDTPGTIAQRYLNDAAKGWMIGEYNRVETTFSGGEAVAVPKAPFRPGGLFPDGYQTVPVLAYTAGAGSPESTQWRAIPAFTEQMQWLKANGFSVVTPAQLIGFMDFTGQLPQRSVLITVDTESQFFHDLAVPVLTAHGFKATIFIAVDRVGHDGAMTWAQLKQLQQIGFTIGCRGRYGRALTRQKKGQSFQNNFKWIEHDLRTAKKEIEQQLGRPCRYLAYPQGRSNSLVSAMAAKLGFSAAFSLSPGDTPFFADRFGIHRTIVDVRTQPGRFGRLLTTKIAADLN